jgi:serine/threonine protein kinase
METRTGQQLGNYRLIRLLGQGGFADVYLGEHVHLGTQAALKVLQMRLAEEHLEMFRNEARAEVVFTALAKDPQNYQNQHSPSDFANQFSNPDLFKGGCLYNNGRATASGDVTVSLTWSRFNGSTTHYTVTLIPGQQNNGWVIDSIA